MIDNSLSGVHWSDQDARPTTLDGRWITHHGWTTAFDRINDFAGMETNRDPRGRFGVSTAAVTAALNLFVLFARRFPVPSDIALPHDIAQLSSGGIQLDWCFDLSELDVTIESDGTISYVLVQYLSVQTADHVDPSLIVELVDFNCVEA